MKRSEAIEEMENTWREYIRNLLSKDFSGIRNGMSLVLYKLEALGMLPPEVEPVPQHIIDNCESSNYWEPEE